MIEFEGTNKVFPTLKEVLAKKTWGEDDITVLCHFKDELDAKTRAKLGIVEPEESK